MIKKLAAKILSLGEEWRKQQGLNIPYPTGEIRNATAMERMFGDCAPTIVAFKIDNGYVVRSVQTGPAYDGLASGFTYCKDHQAIADHIVAESAREKVLDKQMQLKYGGTATGASIGSTSKVLTR